MALIVKDRVQETSSTTGTGTLTLSGAVTGFATFSSSIGNGNTTYYSIVNGSEWEVGLGTVAAGTLSRDTVLNNSLGTTALITLSAGIKNVFVTYPANKAILGSTSSVTSTGTGNVVLSTSPSLVSPSLQAYNEKVETIGSIATSTYNIDLSLANIFDLTLGVNVTVTFINSPASGTTRPITLIVRQPSSSPGKTLTVTGAQYTDGTTPILSTGASQKDVLSYWSIDGGTTYFGTFAMANVS